MDLKRLRYFLAVADNGSISRASEQIGITQQGLSRSIQLLEEELGVALIDRGRNGARLTADGREFVGLAQSLILRFDSDIDKFLNKKSAPKMLRIGLSPAWLPGPGFSPIKLALDRVGVRQASIAVKNHHDLLNDMHSNEIDVAATIRFFGDRDQGNFLRIGSLNYFVVGRDRNSVNEIAEDVRKLADHHSFMASARHVSNRKSRIDALRARGRCRSRASAFPSARLRKKLCSHLMLHYSFYQTLLNMLKGIGGCPAKQSIGYLRWLIMVSCSG